MKTKYDDITSMFEVIDLISLSFLSIKELKWILLLLIVCFSESP